MRSLRTLKPVRYCVTIWRGFEVFGSAGFALSIELAGTLLKSLPSAHVA